MENASSLSQPYAAGVPPRESAVSAVSWAAVFAGAVIAAALSLALFAGGTGLGFLSVSPWADEGMSAPAVGIAVIAWMLFTQIVAYGVGGYVAGRLRTKWVDVHSDEVYFRDTAHGFLVWAVSAVISAALLGSALATLASGAAKAGASVAAGAGAAVTATAAAGASGGGMDKATDYLTDTLLRSDKPDASGDRNAARTEVGRIVAMSLAQGEMTPADRDYVTKVVAAQTGVEPAVAQRRVEQTIQTAKQTAETAKQKAKEAADKARKAAAAFALWGFASMLIGAFVASLAATWGGRRRDAVYKV